MQINSVSVTAEAKAILLVSGANEIDKRIRSLCKKFGLQRSSFATLKMYEGQLVIATSLGLLRTCVNLSSINTSLWESGQAKGFTCGRHGTGRLLRKR